MTIFYWQLHLNVFTWVYCSPGSALSTNFYWICYTQQLFLGSALITNFYLICYMYAATSSESALGTNFYTGSALRSNFFWICFKHQFLLNLLYAATSPGICFKQQFLLNLLYAATSPGSALSTNFNLIIIFFVNISEHIHFLQNAFLRKVCILIENNILGKKHLKLLIKKNSNFLVCNFQYFLKRVWISDKVS